MPNNLPATISRSNVLDAIERLNAGADHLFSESTGYDLLFEGRRYAPKAVIGIAVEIQTGKQLGPYDFKGGLHSRCFRLLEQSGFKIVAKETFFPEEIRPEEVFSEGTLTTVTVNRFERDEKARSESIKHYGATCQVCSFDFKEKYGALGCGFIHVHHIVPLAEIRGAYVVDPVKDLRPICPNCHAMIHRRNPPFDIDELRHLIFKT